MSIAHVHPDAVPAWQDLARLLARLTDAGVQVPCQVDPDPFTSENYRDRAEAAQACRWCPALDTCRRFAESNAESWHVWAGVDLTARTRTIKTERTPNDQL